MKSTFNVTGQKRKALVKAIGEYLGEKPQYQGLPSCAFQIGDFTVDKEGTLEFSDRTDSELVKGLYEALADAGFICEAAESADEEPDDQPVSPTNGQEPVTVEVGIPMKNHTGESLRNLVNILYTRGPLLNKALGTAFQVNPALVKTLEDDAYVITVDRFMKTLTDFETVNGKAINGLEIIGTERLNFGTLPETADPALVRTFSKLVSKISEHALKAKWVQAKEITETNEKYCLRIWLTRLGLNGPNFKEERAILMRNLSGHIAFRTPADQERWKQRQAEKRVDFRAVKAAAGEEKGNEND